jgi:hypothetical protein
MQNARKIKMETEENLKKFTNRIDLDRPILAQEKMKFIMLEKGVEAEEETEKFRGKADTKSLKTDGSP